MSEFKDENIEEKKISRRSALKVGGALAAAGVIGVGLGYGGDLFLRPTPAGTTETSTETTTKNSTVTSTTTATSTATTTATPPPIKWDLTADVVVIGAGAAGLPAALSAQAQGASVIVVEANYDVGGHAIISGGNTVLGGGTAQQIKYGINDSPDLLFQDLTDWTVVEQNGSPDYRYNDRGFIRALADNSVPTYNLLVANGIKFQDAAPNNSGAHSTGNSAAREHHCTYSGPANAYAPNPAGGVTFIRPLEASARSKGVQFLLNYKMNSIVREIMSPAPSGKALGVVTQYTGGRIPPGSTTPLQPYASQGNINMTQTTVNIKANKGVVIATGGHSSNVNFRRIFDPRLTDVYIAGGEPYSFQDASGELAAMAIGASLWGAANQTVENGDQIRTQRAIGIRYNYSPWAAASPMVPFAGGQGLSVANWQDLILVNQVGQRFFDETKGDYPTGNSQGMVKPYTPNSYLNSQYITSSASPGTPYNANSYNFFNAASAPNSASVAPDYSAGPVWAIFDADAVTREKWTVTPPVVDVANGYFYSANTLADLAVAIKNPFQKTPMSGATLQATVTRYNSFVDSGIDSDFGKPKPLYKIQTAPFYAAWGTPLCHDTRSGLRIDMQMKVIDLSGNPIPALYCAGETAGGINQHGLGRCAIGGYIAGLSASKGA